MAVRRVADLPRNAALRQYIQAHDAHAETEQLMVRQGRHIEAEGCRQWARLVIRAWLAERDDPDPQEAP